MIASNMVASRSNVNNVADNGQLQSALFFSSKTTQMEDAYMQGAVKLPSSVPNAGLWGNR